MHSFNKRSLLPPVFMGITWRSSRRPSFLSSLLSTPISKFRFSTHVVSPSIAFFAVLRPPAHQCAPLFRHFHNLYLPPPNAILTTGSLLLIAWDVNPHISVCAHHQCPLSTRHCCLCSFISCGFSHTSHCHMKRLAFWSHHQPLTAPFTEEVLRWQISVSLFFVCFRLIY